MPTYEYACEKCGHVFDLFQSMSEEPLTVCPKDQCVKKRWGRGKVRRAISGGAGLIFKGSGFYITDYRSESYKAAAKSESASAAPKSESKAGGSEKKGADSKSKPSSGGESGKSAKAK